MKILFVFVAFLSQDEERRPDRSEKQDRRESAERSFDRAVELNRDLRRRGAPDPGLPRKERAEGAMEFLRDHEPETFNRIMRETQARKRRIEEMKERDPEGYGRFRRMAEMDRKAAELAETALRSESLDDRRKLEEHLGLLFDVREEFRARGVAELKRRIGKLEKELAGRRKRKAELVEQRVRELLRPREGERGRDPDREK